MHQQRYDDNYIIILYEFLINIYMALVTFRKEHMYTVEYNTKIVMSTISIKKFFITLLSLQRVS